MERKGKKNIEEKRIDSYLDRRLFAIQKSARTQFKIFQRLSEKLRLKFKWYYNFRIDPLYAYGNMDDEMAAIQRSTKTLFRFAQPTHEKLRLKYSWYYRWHVRPHSSKIHFGILAVYTAAIIVSIGLGIFGGPSKHAQAVALSNCTYTNAAGTNYWNNAGNWSCGNVPTNANNVYFDGAVSSAPATIDVAATAASFTVKGTNLPTTGDVAYTGVITANQNLTLDTANAGTGSFYLGAGTYVANATTITVPGNWDDSATAATFTAGTSTVNLTGTGSINTAAKFFYNLQAAAAGKTSTFGASNQGTTGQLILGSGTLTGGYTVDINTAFVTSRPVVIGGGTISSTLTLHGSGTVYVDGGTYTGLVLVNTATYVLTGNLTATALSIYGWNGWYMYPVLDTSSANNYSITATSLQIGLSAASKYYGKLITNNSTITINGNVTVYSSDVANKDIIDATGTSTINVTGNWTNGETFTAGNSTINFTGTGTQTVNSGGVGAGKMFNNVTHSGTGTLQLLTNAINIDGNFSQTAGTFNSNALNQSFAGNFSLSAGTTYTKGGTLTFDGTTSYSDLNATPQNIGAVTLNGTSLTVASGAMQTDALTVTVGSLIQTAGNIKTTGAVSIAASQNWTNNGTGDVTLGGNVTNAGTVTFNGDEAGGQDSISILSSAASARTWTLSGAGTFSFTDVSVSYQTGAAPITATSSNDGGNNTNWTFATNRVISGSLYNGIGGSKITDAKTIKVAVNGVAEASTVETSGGDYTLTLAGDLAANNIVSVFVSGETEKASAIAKTSVAASGINIDLFQNYTVIRHEGTIASIAYADLAIADDLADSDLLFSVDGSNVVTFTQGVYIMGNKTYAPGANAILNTGSWANYGTLTPGAFTITFSAGSGTQTVYSSDTAASPFTGVGKAFNALTHSGAGTLQLTSNLNVDGTLTNSSGPLDLNSLILFEAANLTMTGSTIGATGTITFDGAVGQTFTTAALAYNNITLNNTGTAGANERITVSGNLDINGTLTITDGSLYLVTSNPNVNTSGAVTISTLGLVNKGTGTWTFDGTTTYTDLEATKSNIGPVVINGTSCTLASSMTVDTMTVTSGILNLGTAGYTLKLANNGSAANVLSVSGTLTVGTSTIQYAAVNSGGNINILTIPYSSLQFTPVSGSESYDMTGNLTSANAMAGSVTIDANATVNTYVSTVSYDISCVDITINTSGTLYAGTNGSAGTSTYNISRNWNQANGTFTYGMSTVNMTGTGTITGSNAKPVYKMNAAAAGQTTTLATNLSFALVDVLTLGTGSFTGTGANTGVILAAGIATPLVTSGATMNIPLTYYPSSTTQNVASTTYQNLIFNSIGTANLAGDITAQAITISRAGGGPTVNANTHNITCTSITLGYTTTNYSSTLNMGSGTLTVSGDVTIQASDGSNANTLTYTSGTMNIAGNFIDSDVFTYGTSTVNFNGTTPTTISGTTANTFYNLTATAGKNIIFPAGVTQTIAASGSLGFTGSTAGMVHLRSSIPGTRWNISVPANQNVSYVDVKDSAQTNGTYTITDTSGNDGGNNNVYWVFSGTGNRFWVAPADGNWNSAANWSASSGGAANASIPTSGNTAIFDQAAGAGSYACTINTVVTVDNISVATYTNTITINALTTTNTDINMASGTINAAAAGTVTINGDLLLSGTAVFTAPVTLNLAGSFSNAGTFTPGTGTTFFISTAPTTKYITSGTAHFYNLIFNGTGGSWTMADNSTTDNNFTITAGTVLGGSSTINVAGSYVSTATGIFTYGTSTVNLTGTGTITPTSATNGSFYNLTAAASGKTTTMSGAVNVYNVLTLDTGIWTGNYTLILYGNGTPMVTGGATITSTRIQYSASGAFNVASATYANLNIYSINATGTLAGDITCTTLSIYGLNSTNVSTLDTNGKNITAGAINTGFTTFYGVMKNLSGSVSTINVNSSFTNLVGTIPGNNQILANNMTINMAGSTWANTDLFTAGNSTVNFTGAGTQTLNAGGVGAGKLFNNVTHSGAGTLQLLTNAYEVDGTFSQTAGTFNSNNLAQTYKGNFSLSAGTTYTKGSTVTFSGTTSYSDANTTPQNIGAVTMSGTSTTITSGTMQVDTIALSGGSLIQTAGGVKTTSTITTSGGTFGLIMVAAPSLLAAM